MLYALRNNSCLNILGYVESPVRNMRATIPILESHPPAVYSTVLLTWASITHDCPAMRQIDALSPIAVANSLSCVTHVKSLSRHKAAGSTPPEPWLRPHRTGGSAAREYSFGFEVLRITKSILFPTNRNTVGFSYLHHLHFGIQKHFRIFISKSASVSFSFNYYNK